MNGWMDARMRLNECMNGWTMVSNILAISSRRIASKLRELAARMQRCLQTCINRPGGANLLAAATSNWMSRRGFASKGVSLWHEAFNFLMLTVTVAVTVTVSTSMLQITSACPAKTHQTTSSDRCMWRADKNVTTVLNSHVPKPMQMCVLKHECMCVCFFL